MDGCPSAFQERRGMHSADQRLPPGSSSLTDRRAFPAFWSVAGAVGRTCECEGVGSDHAAP
jgi:hypothetical protein